MLLHVHPSDPRKRLLESDGQAMAVRTSIAYLSQGLHLALMLVILQIQIPHIFVDVVAPHRTQQFSLSFIACHYEL